MKASRARPAAGTAKSHGHAQGGDVVTVENVSGGGASTRGKKS